MEHVLDRQYIFTSFFLLANKLQIIGDRLNPSITMKQWLLLSLIAQFDIPPTLTELAEITGNSRQNVKKMALILVEKGLVQLNKDDIDGRITRIIRTQACIEYYRGRESIEEDFLNVLFEQLSSEEISEFRKTMVKMAQTVYQMEKGYGNESDL